MIPLLLSLSLLLSAAQDKGPAKTPPQKSTEKAAQEKTADPKRVQAATAELDAAFKDGKSPERIAAIEKNADVVDGAVIERIAKGLKDKDAAVKQAAIEALGRMKHPDSVKALNGLYNSEKKTLATDEAMFPLLLKSIGRLGDPSSVAVLSDSPFSSKIFPSIQARLYGLGNIRTNESVEALVGFMKLGAERDFQALMPEWRVALVHLTGVDNGDSIDLWQKWWREKKKDFKLPAEAAPMSPELQMKWDAYWNAPSPKKEPEAKREPEKK
jgi:hypothetical protein